MTQPYAGPLGRVMSRFTLKALFSLYPSRSAAIARMKKGDLRWANSISFNASVRQPTQLRRARLDGGARQAPGSR
jgi:hypothetical protein